MDKLVQDEAKILQLMREAEDGDTRSIVRPQDRRSPADDSDSAASNQASPPTTKGPISLRSAIGVHRHIFPVTLPEAARGDQLPAVTT